MTCMRTRLLLGLSLLAAVAARPSAQQPAAAPATAAEQSGVTFRVEVNYVEVDAAVFDRQGRFVNDLTREDFQVLEEGVPQEVSAFTLVNIPIEHAERPLYAKMPIEPDVASNAKPFEGRVYVIVLDDLQTAASRSMLVRRAARQFIEQAMAANDMAAIVYTSGRGEAGQEFTSSSSWRASTASSAASSAPRRSSASTNINGNRAPVSRPARTPIASTIPSTWSVAATRVPRSTRSGTSATTSAASTGVARPSST